MEKTQFGSYSLGFALVLLVAGLISSPIAAPFVVNLPDQSSGARLAYAVHHTAALGLVCLAVIALALVVAFVLTPLKFGVFELDEIITPVAVAGSFYAVRDMLSRVAYSEHREAIVMFSSLAVASGVGLAFSGLWVVEKSLSAQTALYAYALGQFIGCIALLWRLCLPWTSLNRSGLQKAFLDSWAGGRWNVLTGVVYNVRTQVHNFVVGPLLGASVLAEVNAARVLVTPATMLIPTLTQVLMPRLADKRRDGSGTVLRSAGWATGGLLALATLYSAALLTVSPWLVPLALGGGYDDVTTILAIWCLVAIALATRNGLTLVLQVTRAFRQILSANLAAAVVAVILAIILSERFGGPGAVAALAASEIFLSAVLFVILRKSIRSPEADARLGAGS